jgi:Outer membrane protein beta-barrel domain
MMKKILYLFAFVFVSLNLNSQNFHFEFTTSPISLIDPTHPNIRVGGEFYIGKHFSVSADFGYGMTLNYKLMSLFYDSRDYTKYNFYQIRPEIKYLFLIDDNQHCYVGLEYFYLEENNIIKNDYYDDFIGQLHFSKANYFRNKEGVHLKFGAKVSLDQNFIMDIYLGPGIIRKYAEFSNMEQQVYHPKEPNLYFYGNLFSGYLPLTIHLALGIKVGLRL